MKRITQAPSRGDDLETILDITNFTPKHMQKPKKYDHTEDHFTAVANGNSLLAPNNVKGLNRHDPLCFLENQSHERTGTNHGKGELCSLSNVGSKAPRA